jgi:DNA-binding beta-propeller fold protein YncE
MRDSHGTASRPAVVVLLAVVALVLSAAGLTPTASATLPQSPVLALEQTVVTRPFTGSGVSTTDNEGSAYVPQDNSLWLADDDGHAVYEIDLATGALKRTIHGDRFANVEELGGGPRAGQSRVAEIQALAYDPTRDTLYAYSGTCCPAAIYSTAFRLTRKDGVLVPDSFQALPLGLQVEGAAWNPCDGRVYVSGHGAMWDHDYATNTLGQGFGIAGITHPYGIDFSDDGKDLFVAQPYTRVTRVDWATRTVVPGWDLNLAGLGPQDIRAVEVIGDRLWVSDGSDKRVAGDPLDHALFVFGVGASGAVSGTASGSRRNLVGNAEFKRDLCGWDTTLPRTDVALTRTSKGHSGSGAARVERTHGKGDLRLAAVPTWVVKKRKHAYKASIWVRSSNPAGAKLQLRLRELYAGRYVVDEEVTKVRLTQKWQRVSVSLDPGRAGRRIALDLRVKNVKKGASFLADGARVRVS